VTLALAVLLAAVSLAVTAPAAADTTSATPAGGASSAIPSAVTPPTPAAAPTTARVVRLGERVDGADLTALAADLTGATGAVVVVPEGARLTGTLSAAPLQRLDAVRGLAVVLTPGGPGGDAARVLAAFADKTYSLPDASLAAPHDAALWRAVAAQRSCPGCPLKPIAEPNAKALGNAIGATYERHDLPTTSLASVLGPATVLPSDGGDDGDGATIWRLLVLILVASLLALGARALWSRRDRRPAQPDEPRRDPGPGPKPTGGGKSHTLPDHRPGPLSSAGEAIVRSELQPDGYVELDRVLRRARWADPRTPAPAAGQRVHVETDRGGALVATASQGSR
jgi:hypothetical protein